MRLASRDSRDAEFDIPHSIFGIRYYLLLTPYSLLLTPYSLLLTPYSLLLTPYSLLLTSLHCHPPPVTRYSSYVLHSFLSHRNAQLSGIIRSVVAEHAIQIPPQTAKVVSIVEVILSKDLSYADVTVSALEGAEAAIAFLMRHKGEIRKKLAAKLRVHKIPILRFHFDKEGERGNRLDELLQTIENEKRRASSG